MASTAQSRSGSQAVERAIHLLNCFEGDDPELTVSELAHLAGVPVSTAHRLAQALVRGGMLEQDARTDRYRIGHGLAVLARPALERLGVDLAAPHLFALAAGIGITTSLSVAREREAVTVFQARPPVRFCNNQIPLPRQPLQTSAVGRAVLAFADGRRIDRRACTGPIVDLDRVRRNGFAVADLERNGPLRSVAVPVFGADRRVWGALGVQARSARLDEQLVRAILPAMRRTAATISPLLHSDVAS